MYVCMYVCRVFCPKAGPSLDMHHQGSTYHSFLDKGEERGSMPIPFLTEPWLCGNTFHCTHRHKSAVNTTIKHPQISNNSQNVTASLCNFSLVENKVRVTKIYVTIKRSYLFREITN